MVTEELSIPIPVKDPEVSEIYNYLGFGRIHSSCELQIWFLEGDRAVILFTERDHGTSVTNAAETLVEVVYKYYLKGPGIDKTKCLFMETYPYEGATIDQIVPVWDGDQVISVNWVYIGKRIKPEAVKDESRE